MSGLKLKAKILNSKSRDLKGERCRVARIEFPFDKEAEVLKILRAKNINIEGSSIDCDIRHPDF